jgi:uncharacterized membrane protein
MMYKERPRIPVQTTSTDKWLDWISYFLLFFLIGYTIYFYSSLPDTIPAHLNIEGQVDYYDSKETIWVLPAVGLFFFILLTILLRFPHIYNYPVKITVQNAGRIYASGVRFIRIVRLWMMIVLIIVIISFIRMAKGINKNSDTWLLPVILLLALGLLIFSVVRFFNIRKQDNIN